MFWQKEKKELSTGEQGEQAAKKFLKKKGFKILAQNYQNAKGKRLGEIDIIAREKGQIVFVEVKTRIAESNDVLPEANIDRKKLVRLQKIALFYLREKNWIEKDYRFDAVSVIMSLDKNVLEIRHLESIFFQIAIQIGVQVGIQKNYPPRADGF